METTLYPTKANNVIGFWKSGANISKASWLKPNGAKSLKLGSAYLTKEILASTTHNT